MRAYALVSGLLLAVTGLACGGDDGGGGGVCARGASKLRSCGLATEGDFTQCDEPQNAAERCEANCILNASCEDLDTFFCTVNTPANLATCVSACPDDSTGDFTCTNGTQIPGDWECDGEADCTDASDEANCPEPEMFTCGDGEQIPAAWQCDGGAPDCTDGSDEEGCPDGLELICN